MLRHSRPCHGAFDAGQRKKDVTQAARRGTTRPPVPVPGSNRRTLTCTPSIAVDVKNAGGLYVDRPVVEDRNVITSRKPEDIAQFGDAILRALRP